MKLKRFLSLFLAFVLILGMSPMAFATGTDPTAGTDSPDSTEAVSEPATEPEDTEATPPASSDPPDSTDPSSAGTEETGIPSEPIGEPDGTEAPSEPQGPTLPPQLDIDPNEYDVMPLDDSGSSGSDIGGGDGGGDAVTPPPGVQGGGNLLWTAPGVTLQVVLFPYGETYDRNLSYNNVIDVVQTYKNGSTQTVFDGFSTTSSTFIADLTTGRVYRIPHYNPADKTFAFRGGYHVNTGAAGITIHPGVNNCVSGPATVVDGPREQTVTMPVMNDIEAFLQHIILGNAVGAWDKLNVCMDINGNSLDNWDRSNPSSAPTSADDYSLFARVLRYLGVKEEYINNYVLGYTGQLDKTDDHDVLIPTIIWSYCIAESTAAPVTDTGDGAMPFYYTDPSSTIADNTYFLSSKPYEGLYNYWLTGRVYTVGDMFNSSATALRVPDPVDKFNAWWKTDFEPGEGGSSPTTKAYNAAVGGCGWDITSSYACNFLFGQYHRNGGQHGYTQDRNYCKYANGSGFVNRINAQGVDNSSGTLYYYRGYWTPYGVKAPVTEANVTLQKSIDGTSAEVAQLQGNALYSLAGAQYGIYKNGVLQETLTTDANGYAVSTKKYAIGTALTVRETKAPQGYKLDTHEYVLTVSEGVNQFNVKDEPVYDPPFALTKVDTEIGNPQGNTTFQGAVFKFEYFDNLTYSFSGTAKRTWYFVTDANGRIDYDPNHLASGYSSDALYSFDGNYSMPIGSIRITEIVNPIGYTLLSQSLTCTIIPDANDSSGAKFVWNTADGSDKIFTQIHAGRWDELGIKEPENINSFGSFTLQKQDSITKKTTPQGNGSLAGAVFEVVNQSTNSVKIGNHAEAAPGEVCFTFTVDANGKYSSGKIFPIGKYLIREKTPSPGYKIPENWSYTFEVTAGSSAPADVKIIVDEPPILGSLKIIKQDANLGSSTGKEANLDGIKFAVINTSTHPVQVNGVTYNNGATVMTLELKWDGKQWSASTEKVLPYGTYRVQELPQNPGSDMANDYYHLNTTPQTADISLDGETVVLTFDNQPKVFLGGIQIIKQDAELGDKTSADANLAGIKFAVINANSNPVLVNNVSYSYGATIMTLVPKWDGKQWSISTGKVLPAGTYVVRELPKTSGSDMANDDYYLNVTPQTAVIGTDGNTVVLIFDNQPKEIFGGIQIIKYDKALGANTGSDARLSGIKYTIHNANGHDIVTKNGRTYADGQLMATLTLVWNNSLKCWCASTPSMIYPSGTYLITEQPMEPGSNMANEYYYLNNKPQLVTITTDGALHRVYFENQKKSDKKLGSFSLEKIDAETGLPTPQGDATFAGAQFQVTYTGSGTVTIDGIVYSRGSVVYTFTLDANGQHTTDKIFPVGTYTIREKAAPEGYKLNMMWTRMFSVVNDGDHTALTYENNTAFPNTVIRGGIKIIKYDEALGTATGEDAKLDGITYSIINNSANAVEIDDVLYDPGDVVMVLDLEWDGTAWTASTGNSVLPYGNYIIRENPMSPGSNMANAYYFLNNQDQEKDVHSNGVLVNVVFENEKAPIYGGFTLKKVDADTNSSTAQGNASLAGAKFQVIYTGSGSVKVGSFAEATNGQICYEFTVGSSGTYVSGDIFPAGSYIIKEVSAPTGYHLNEDWAGSFTVENNGDKTELVCDEEVFRGGIKIIKYDEDLGANTGEDAELDGITFSIINNSTNPVVIDDVAYPKGEVVMVLEIKWDGTNWSASTGADALPYGSYIVRENPMEPGSNMANQFYELNNEDQSKDVTSNGVEVVVTFDNVRKEVPHGGFTLEKVDAETGKPDPQGGAKFEGAKFNVTFTGNGSLEINGITYNKGQICYTFTLDANGQFTSGDIFPAGSYSIKEAEAPEGYELNTTWTGTFTVTKTGDTENLTYEEHKACPDNVIRGGVKIIKLNADQDANTDENAKLNGIKFTVYSNNDNVVVVNGVEYKKGNAVLVMEIKWDGTNWTASSDIDALPYGDYIVKENPMTAGSNLANPYYLLNMEPQEITISEKEKYVTVTFDNEEVPYGSFTLEKIDSETGKQDPQGCATFEGAKFEVTYTGDGFVMVNGTRYEKGKVCYTFTLDANGQFTSDDIFPVGSYSIKEVEAPEGYKLNEDWVETFTVTNGENFSFTYEKNKACPDQVIRGGLTIIKYDEDLGDETGEDALLEGITFSVINANENSVMVDGQEYAPNETVLILELEWDGTRWTASSAIDALPYGTYTVKENPMEDGSDMANEDYYLNMEPQEITISEEGATVSVTFENKFKVIPGKITIYKADPVGNPLADAKFLLEWSEDGINWLPVEYSEEERPYKGSCGTEGLVDGCLTVDSSGMITFENLYVGLYYRVTELEAPEGYLLLTDYAYEGILTKEEATAELTVVNSPGFGLPTTGSVGAKLHAAFGAFLLVSGMMCLFALAAVSYGPVFYRQKARNKTHNKERN